MKDVPYVKDMRKSDANTWIACNSLISFTRPQSAVTLVDKFVPVFERAQPNLGDRCRGHKRGAK